MLYLMNLQKIQLGIVNFQISQSSVLRYYITLQLKIKLYYNNILLLLKIILKSFYIIYKARYLTCSLWGSITQYFIR